MLSAVFLSLHGVIAADLDDHRADAFVLRPHVWVVRVRQRHFFDTADRVFPVPHRRLCPSTSVVTLAFVISLLDFQSSSAVLPVLSVPRSHFTVPRNPKFALIFLLRPVSRPLYIHSTFAKVVAPYPVDIYLNWIAAAVERSHVHTSRAELWEAVSTSEGETQSRLLKECDAL